jgi:hypothetical protein
MFGLLDGISTDSPCWSQLVGRILTRMRDVDKAQINLTSSASGDPLLRFVPDAVLPRLPVPLHWVALDNGTWFRDSDHEDREPEFVELPNDLAYRELAELDLADPQTIERFLRSHGPVRLEDFPWTQLVRPSERPPAQRRTGEVHWQHVALYLRAVRAMANHWKLATSTENLSTTWEREELPSAWEAEGFMASWTPSLAWERFETILGHGLAHRAFSPHLRWGGPPTAEELYDERRLPDLFSALCAEIWNVAVNGISVRECANERCTNPFTQKRGSTGNRRRRERFCDPQCERAQSQREYRRREQRKKTTNQISRSGTESAPNEEST